MKKIIPLLLCLFICGISAYSQFNRANTKKSVPYRSNYQRMITGGSSDETFEIRNGTLWHWGSYNNVSYPDNTTPRILPQQVGTDNNWSCVTVSGPNAFAIKTNGTLWHSNNASTGFSQVGTDDRWVSVSTAGTTTTSSFGLKVNGTLWNLSSTPSQIGSEDNWVSVVALDNGSNNILALKGNGTIWGVNGNVTVQIGTANDWTNIAGGMGFALALKSNGTLWSWGDNTFGQLGIGSTVNQSNPTQIGTDHNWVSIAAGGYHSMATRSNGTLWCWGKNDKGQLGIGSNTNQNTPVQVGTGTNWVAISAGKMHSVGLQANGAISTWGENYLGQLGDGTGINKNAPSQVRSADNAWLSIKTSPVGHSIGLKSDGTIWNWGVINFSPATPGGPYGANAYVYSPVQVGTDNDWICVTAGLSHTLAIKANGTVWAWGDNFSGQLGNGTTIASASPIQVGTSHDWVSISAFYLNSIALKSDGTMWDWGYPIDGIGGGPLPVQLTTATDWVSVKVGTEHGNYIKSNGTMWASGSDEFGEMGTNDDGTPVNIPVQVGTDQNWNAIELGVGYCYGLKTNGTSWAWGAYNSGQLGNGDSTFQNNRVAVPTQIDMNDVIVASACDQGTAAMTANGSIYAWGYGIFLPQQITAENGWAGITNGETVGGHKIILTLSKDRSKYCGLGDNIYGSLGDNTNISRTTLNCEVSPVFICNAPAAPSVFNSTSNICQNQSAIFDVSGAGSTHHLSWYDAASGGNWVAAGGHFVTPVLTSSKTYYVQDSTCASSARTACYVIVSSDSGNYTENVVACNSYTWHFSTYTTSGTHYYYTHNANGCPQTITLNLTINHSVEPVPGAITGQTNASLYMNGASAAYPAKKAIGGTNYIWTVPTGATITGHPGNPTGSTPANDTIINVTYDPATFPLTPTSTTAISVMAVGDCGTSLPSKLAITRGPAIKAGKFISPQLDICQQQMSSTNTLGTPVLYKINKIANATSYLWSVPAGTSIASHPAGLGANDTAITVIFNSTFPAAGAAITVQGINPSYTGLLTTTGIIKAVMPKVPGTITGTTNTCTSIAQGTIIRYAVTRVALATGYDWSFVNTTAGGNPSQAVIVSHPALNATGDPSMDTAINVQFYPGFLTGRIEVRAKRNCGISAAKTLTVSKLKITNPAGFTIAGNLAVCPSTTETYTCPLVTNAMSYNWTVPATGTITAGAGTNSITVSYAAVLPAAVGKLTVTPISLCGNGATVTKSIAKALTCRENPAFQKSFVNKTVNTNTKPNFEVSIYPNPSRGNFTIAMTSNNKADKMEVVITNESGTIVFKGDTKNISGIASLQINNNFSNGIYFATCIVGAEKITKKIIISR